jgi:hypothetical protein
MGVERGSEAQQHVIIERKNYERRRKGSAPRRQIREKAALTVEELTVC